MDGSVWRLLEEQQREKKAVLETLLELEKKLDEKQKLELEIEVLKGKLKVQECMGADNGKGAEEMIDEMQEELKENIEELNYIESLNQTLTEKECKSNDELQAARQEMISVCEINEELNETLTALAFMIRTRIPAPDVHAAPPHPSQHIPLDDISDYESSSSSDSS